MGLSIRTKIVSFGIMGLVLSAGVGTIAIYSAQMLSGTLEEVELSSNVLRNHMEADMMHDALRGDVYAAIEASTPEAQQATLADVKEHSETFRRTFCRRRARSRQTEASRKWIR